MSRLDRLIGGIKETKEVSPDNVAAGIGAELYFKKLRGMQEKYEQTACDMGAFGQKAKALVDKVMATSITIDRKVFLTSADKDLSQYYEANLLKVHRTGQVFDRLLSEMRTGSQNEPMTSEEKELVENLAARRTDPDRACGYEEDFRNNATNLRGTGFAAHLAFVQLCVRNMSVKDQVLFMEDLIEAGIKARNFKNNEEMHEGLDRISDLFALPRGSVKALTIANSLGQSEVMKTELFGEVMDFWIGAKESRFMGRDYKYALDSFSDLYALDRKSGLVRAAQELDAMKRESLLARIDIIRLERMKRDLQTDHMFNHDYRKPDISRAEIVAVKAILNAYERRNIMFHVMETIGTFGKDVFIENILLALETMKSFLSVKMKNKGRHKEIAVKPKQGGFER